MTTTRGTSTQAWITDLERESRALHAAVNDLWAEHDDYRTESVRLGEILKEIGRMNRRRDQIRDELPRA